MTSTVKTCMPSGIYKLFPWWHGLAKTCKAPVSFFKKVAVNCYNIHMISIFYCMPQHYIPTMEYYITFHYKEYTKYKNILFINIIPYRITPEHVITMKMKCSSMDNKTICKFQSNTKDICILNTMHYVSRQCKSE